MKKLSVSQEYLLCSLNEKGKLSSLDTKVLLCLVAASLLELQLKRCIATEDEKVIIKENLPSELSYLASLYDFLKEKPRSVKKIAENYTFTFSNKRINTLIDAIGMSLVEAGRAGLEQGGLMGSKDRYTPDQNAVDKITQRIREELLGTDPLREETLILALLLEKSKQLKKHFSTAEKKDLSTKLKELKNTDYNRVIKEMIEHIDDLMVLFVAVAGN